MKLNQKSTVLGSCCSYIKKGFEYAVVNIAEQLFDASPSAGTTCCSALSEVLFFCLTVCSVKLLLILPLDVRFATPPDMTLSSFHGGNGRLLLLLCFHPLQHFCFLPVSTYMLLFMCLLLLPLVQQCQIYLFIYLFCVWFFWFCFCMCVDFFFLSRESYIR